MAGCSAAAAVSTDIIEASALAFLQVINRIAQRTVARRAHPADGRSAAAGNRIGDAGSAVILTDLASNSQLVTSV